MTIVAVFYNPTNKSSEWVDTACQMLEIAETPFVLVDHNNRVFDPQTDEPLGELETFLNQRHSDTIALVGSPKDIEPYAQHAERTITSIPQLFEWLWWEVRAND